MGSRQSNERTHSHIAHLRRWDLSASDPNDQFELPFLEYSTHERSFIPPLIRMTTGVTSGRRRMTGTGLSLATGGHIAPFQSSLQRDTFN